MDEERFMIAAIAAADEGIEKGQTPFGACIAREAEILAVAHNAVWQDTDITAHAEIRAIRDACAKLAAPDLTGCVIYSTCEPCPMCFAACHWAKIGRIVFGARIEDARKAGFGELAISNEEMKSIGGSSVQIVPDFLRAECLGLFETWSARPDRRAY